MKSWLTARNAFATKNILRGSGKTIWVSAARGNAVNEGIDYEHPLLTIPQAQTLAVAGDIIKVEAGVYSATINLVTNDLTLDCEKGVEITTAAAACPLTVSGNGILVRGCQVYKAGQTAITVSGNNCVLEDVNTATVMSLTGFGVYGTGNLFVNCYASAYSSVGWYIASTYTRFVSCQALGDGIGSEGFHLVADYNVLEHCVSNRNTLVGWQCIAGADSNTMFHCGMSQNEPAKIDAGANNAWIQWHEGSQIVLGQTIDQDLKDIYDSITGHALSFVGIVTSVTAGTTTFECTNLIGFGNDYFNTGWRLHVIYNANSHGAYPETQMSDITDYVSTTGQFVISPPLTANIEVGDYIMVIKEAIIAKTAQTSIINGTCDTGMGASATTIVCRDLAGYGDDYFNVDWLLQVAYNTNSHGAAPEGELKEITDYVSDTGTFTINNLTANAEAGDLVMIVRKEHLNALTECNTKCGRCNVGMGASTVTVVCAELAGFSDDIFNNVGTQAKWWMTVLKNNSAVNTAPEGETRMITDYVSSTGTFTVQPFSANVEASDYIMLMHDSLYNKLELGNIFNLVNADLVLNETGGSVTTDGTEQNVYINATPSGVFKPLVVSISFDNMLAGDSVTVRVYDIMAAAGAFALSSAPITYTGADGGLLGGSVKDYIILNPNRFGVKVTIQRTMGVDRAYPWEVFKES